jgi:hypothetical protein
LLVKDGWSMFGETHRQGVPAMTSRMAATGAAVEALSARLAAAHAAAAWWYLAAGS